MARPPKQIPEDVLRSLVSDWRAGLLSETALQTKYKLDKKTIGKRMEDLGEVRQQGAILKREMVRVAVAGIDPADPAIGEQAHAAVTAAAKTDTDAMTVASRGALLILLEVERQASPPTDSEKAKDWKAPRPGDLNSLALAQKNAAETYRKARELDNPEPGENGERRIVLVHANHGATA